MDSAGEGMGPGGVRSTGRGVGRENQGHDEKRAGGGPRAPRAARSAEGFECSRWLVPGAGLEPARSYEQEILSL